MVKRIGRRFVSLLLTFVTILTLLPAMTLPALAATSGTVNGLADENIGLSFSGDAEDAWIANGALIKGAATSTAGFCSNTDYKSTLTITNKKSTKATLSFDYAVTGSDGTIRVNSTWEKEKDGSHSFSKELAAGASIKVYISSGSPNAATTITMTKVKLVASATAKVTFQPAENGSYTVNGTAITAENPKTQSSMTAYQVVATPATGYQFMGWYDTSNGRYISTAATTALNIESDCTITARFASKTETLFETAGQRFVDLNDAIVEAKKKLPATIVLASDGSITGDYTIPSGVTLLIPFDEAGTLYKATPTATRSDTAATPFRTLTMAAGSSITLASGAAISVGGQYYAGGGGQSGKMVGSYGCIKMESGSAITVQNGASLYAWGFISGSGAVTVESRGSVYEWYQILDFRGGSATSGMENKVFPFNQYAVQNIEVPLTVHTDASEKAYAAIFAMNKTFRSSISFIGAGSLFELNSGRLTKAYDGSTDRIIYTIDGVALLNNLSLSLGDKDVNSKDYVLPLTNNMTIDLKSGSKLTLNQTAALLPGVKVSIARNAELEVPDGQSMYIYDKQEWGGYCGAGDAQYMSVVVAPGKKYNRTDNDLVDVKVDVNGTLTAIGGIYTTASGADICSSAGTGVYNQQGTPGTETKTYQYTQKDGVTAHEIPITPAQLQNATGDPTLTASSSGGKTFTYCACPTCGGKWTNGLKVAEIDENDGKLVTTHETLKEAVGKLEDGQYIKMLHNTTEDITANKNLYLDLNGRTVTGNFTMNDNTLFYGMDSTTDGYDGTNAGKIVGSVVPYNKITYQTGNAGEAYKRYVGILREENGTPTLSFHRFNISVTGYRFELAAPECALFFIGQFRGDDAAKNHLKSLGFTLTDIAGETTNPRYDIPDVEKIPSESNPGESPVVLSSDGAFLFEAYLIREIDKGDSNTYQKQFSATAKATFNNSGVQDEDNSRSSVERKLSFQQALWDALSAPDMEEKDKKILMNFLNDMNIPNPNPNP